MNHGFPWICTRSGIGKSYGNSIFRFSRNFHNVLHSDCVNLHSHRECNSVPFFPHSIICCVQIWGWWPFWLVWGDTSLYISFAFFWYLVMLSIFSGHLYVFFEGMFVYTLCLLFYGIVYLTQRCMSYYIFWRLLCCCLLCLPIFPLILWVVFLFLVSFCCVEAFDFN